MDVALRWVNESEWACAQEWVPILCVEAVLVRGAHDSLQVGLIQRYSPFGTDPVWCQIGGRVMRNEVLTSALTRHISGAVSDVSVDLGTDPQPLYVMQFLPSGPVAEAPWAGTDPRKHSVSLCYLVSVSTDPVCRTGGEALNFKWFGVDELAGLTQMWPGASHLIDALLARSGLSSS